MSTIEYWRKVIRENSDGWYHLVIRPMRKEAQKRSKQPARFLHLVKDFFALCKEEWDELSSFNMCEPAVIFLWELDTMQGWNDEQVEALFWEMEDFLKIQCLDESEVDFCHALDALCTQSTPGAVKFQDLILARTDTFLWQLAFTNQSVSDSE